MVYKYNKLYFYRYKSIEGKNYKGNVYDRSPLMIPLEIGKNIILGINLHWIPIKARKEFVQFVIKLVQKSKENKKFKSFRLYYQLVKNDKTIGPFAMKAIRKYYVKNMTKAVEIEVKDWEKTLTNIKFKSHIARKEKGFRY